MTECSSFLPAINNGCKILILGSMPGVKSLERQEYYAHPQNRFWKVMGKLCKEPGLAGFSYEGKLKSLLDKGFALWDVIKFCKRDGSLDSDITDEIPNDIRALLQEYKGIRVIFLNGNKAYSSFKKHFPDLLNKYRCVKLPSTSPANARYRLEDLTKEWEKALLCA